MPRLETRLLYLDHIAERGRDMFGAACDRDLEGIVAKWVHGTYKTDSRRTSWVKIKNPEYTHRRSLLNERPPQIPIVPGAAVNRGWSARGNVSI
jgi:hypothetical protein